MLFLLRKHYSVEPEEVKTYVKSNMIHSFSKMLQLKGINKDSIGIIISNIGLINKKFLSKVSSGYNDFFLYYDYYYFTNYKVKVFEYLQKCHYSENDKTYRIVKRCLDQLDDFYRNKEFYNIISNLNISTDTIKTIGDEIDGLFLSLNTDVIVSNKLYARMRMLHLDELTKLGELNNPKDIYRLAKTYYEKKYYFKEPFISKDKNSNLTNDEIIYSYAYTLDEISVSKLNQYADKMHLKKLDNYLQFFDETANDYIQIDESKLMKKEKLDIDPEVLEKIKSELTFYLDSFGSIDSETYEGYNTLPSLNSVWNKYLLLGLCRTYFDEVIAIKYNGKQYKKLSFKLELK